MNISEEFLQYIWFNRLFDEPQKTTTGECVEVIDLGQPNSNAGADVFNAKIRIGNTLWAGNVEFHTKASHWRQHNHHTNRAYNSVILHVVFEEDDIAIDTNNIPIPQMIVRYNNDIKERYKRQKMPFVVCADQLYKCSNKDYSHAFNGLIEERLNRKTSAINQLLEKSNNDWEEAFYIITARSFGFGTNADAFELLARLLPQRIIAKHKDNLLQVEALLFGVAGFLEENPIDDYQCGLQKEFKYLKQKYDLTSLDYSQWKFLRLRPANFPTIRISQFANLIYESSKLFSKVIEQQSYSRIRDYYTCGTSDYWKTHYVFGKKSTEKDKYISKSSVDIVLINSVVPFFYAYGKYINSQTLQGRAIGLLETMASEKNHITKGFEAVGIESRSAKDSQALAELKAQYCDRKECYVCKNRLIVYS